MSNIRDDIDLRFKSGNEVPIERAYIRKEEWEFIKARLDVTAKDARRYRWLRDEAKTARKSDPIVIAGFLPTASAIHGSALDSAVDAAMSALLRASGGDTQL